MVEISIVSESHKTWNPLLWVPVFYLPWVTRLERKYSMNSFLKPAGESGSEQLSDPSAFLFSEREGVT